MSSHNPGDVEKARCTPGESCFFFLFLLLLVSGRAGSINSTSKDFFKFNFLMLILVLYLAPSPKFSKALIPNWKSCNTFGVLIQTVF